MLKKFFFLSILLTLLAGGLGAAILFWMVAIEPGEEISLENIQSILGRESQVYYSDGVTRLGVFFDTAHRQYVDFEDIPKDFVNGLVAAEDNRFFSHFGFDLLGIGRAMIKNIMAGRIVQGGSTLTQQTAKNLFKRSERSYKAKLKELIYALRLEYHYSKEQIFEFYANQFYVSGNGHGLGVAARYYFDKKPEELNLAECAFIAGSVKRPNYYNPFRKKTEEGKRLAMQRSRIRLGYVLGKMRELGMIDKYRYSQAMTGGLTFKKGQVGYSLDYSMELVRDAVSADEVETVLSKHGIDNIATSGIKIITTVDKAVQRKALAILREELSRLDVRLRGYDRENVAIERAQNSYKGDRILSDGSFHFGRITTVQGSGKQARVSVVLNGKPGTGIIDRAGLEEMVLAYARYRKNRWSESSEEDWQKLLEQLQPGDEIWVKVRGRSEKGELLLDLEKYPKVQGAAIVLREGQIRAVVGGTENRFYNRAVQANRTMGSAFKPPVFAAALQLGWNSGDLLNNKRDVFVFHGMPYFPRPDHHSPHEQVSMNWAGVFSENLASVWLLTHLCDKLTPIQFRDLAEHLDLAPKVIDGEPEPYRSYRARIRDRYGVVVDRDTLREAAYSLALKNLETDFLFDNLEKEYRELKEIPYGLGFRDFAESLERELEQARKEDRKEYEIRELELRLSLLSNNFLKLESLRDGLRVLRENLAYGSPGWMNPDPVNEEERLWRIGVDKVTGNFVYLSEDEASPDISFWDERRLRKYLDTLAPYQQETFWQEVRLNRSLSAGIFDRVSEQLNLEYRKLLQGLPYSFETLSQVRDFRITVGLAYIVQLLREMGVRSDLEPVLSFPLGSNVVTLLETTRLYEGMVTGVTTTYGDSGDESLAIIDRIESEDGKILYRPKRKIVRNLDPRTSLAIGSILENTVVFGTGRRADRTVRLKADDLDLAIPLLGKTGTANNYTNASFFGYLPGLSQNGMAMVLDGGYSIGVYVGFDDNTPMRKGSSRITGSAGALPTWCGIVNSLVSEEGYLDKVDPVDLSFNGLIIDWPALGQKKLAVDPQTGGRVVEPVQQVAVRQRYEPSLMTFGTVSPMGRLNMDRQYKPFWENRGSNHEKNGDPRDDVRAGN